MTDKIETSRRQFLTSTGATTVSAASTAFAASNLFPHLIRDALAVPAANAYGSLADVAHVVIFMQENRSFDHYFGTYPGVRGFNDPRAITLPDGKPVWCQPNALGKPILPFHFDAKNTSAMQIGTDHSWKGTQTAWQGWDAWVKKKTPQSMGFFDRADLPFYYALADAFTICDAYHCSIFGATDPNRMYSLTGGNQGWLKSMGSLYNIDAAGYYHNDPKYDNISASVTNSAPNWRTYAEVLEANNVSWKVYQEWDNYGDNYLAYFKNFRVNSDGTRLSTNSPLYQKARMIAPGSSENNTRGTKGQWLVDQFSSDVKNNRLPQVSWICAPSEYCEHSPGTPNAGENLTARLLAALVANPEVWSKTVFLLTYDENDGFFDHVPPVMAALDASMGKNTMTDIGQFENYGGVPVGVGPRVPMLVISPWSKGGKVCSQLFDHTSKLRFLEEWLVQGLGKRREHVQCEQISPWRRAVCGDLRTAFDFQQPNLSWPTSVPSTAAYNLINGKPYPQPPAFQSFPQQELPAGGTRQACPLPYELAVHSEVNNTAKQVALSFHNSGQAGVSFIVYSLARKDGPWYYTVEAGKKIENEVWNWQGENYHLRIHGPNGFVRELQGNFSAAAEIQVQHDRQSGDLQVILNNQKGQAACQFFVQDKSYGKTQQSHQVGAGQQMVMQWPLQSSFGWYDLWIQISNFPQFIRKIAGHVETGKTSRTDPSIGTTASVASLRVTSASAVRGAELVFAYTVPNKLLDAQNWIGIYKASSTPGSGSSLQWVYAPLSNGVFKLNTANLPAGEYAAWLLYQNGYVKLAGPCLFKVSEGS